ncbi:unnamed protein product [Lampetra planeri]
MPRALPRKISEAQQASLGAPRGLRKQPQLGDRQITPSGTAPHIPTGTGYKQQPQQQQTQSPPGQDCGDETGGSAVGNGLAEC